MSSTSSPSTSSASLDRFLPSPSSPPIHQPAHFTGPHPPAKHGQRVLPLDPPPHRRLRSHGAQAEGFDDIEINTLAVQNLNKCPGEGNLGLQKLGIRYIDVRRRDKRRRRPQAGRRGYAADCELELFWVGKVLQVSLCCPSPCRRRRMPSPSRDRTRPPRPPPLPRPAAVSDIVPHSVPREMKEGTGDKGSRRLPAGRRIAAGEENRNSAFAPKSPAQVWARA